FPFCVSVCSTTLVNWSHTKSASVVLKPSAALSIEVRTLSSEAAAFFGAASCCAAFFRAKAFGERNRENKNQKMESLRRYSLVICIITCFRELTSLGPNLVAQHMPFMIQHWLNLRNGDLAGNGLDNPQQLGSHCGGVRSSDRRALHLEDKA